jgi:hypothetical protein
LRPQLVEPALSPEEIFAVEAACSNPTPFPRNDEAGVFEHGDMLDERRQCHVERRRQFAHACRTFTEPANHGPARRVRQRVKNGVERRISVSHTANYRALQYLGQWLSVYRESRVRRPPSCCSLRRSGIAGKTRQRSCLPNRRAINCSGVGPRR